MFKKFAQIIGIIAVLAAMFTLPVQAASVNTISGTITHNSVGLKGVVVSIKGTSFKATTNALGNYSIHNVPSGTTGSIVPVLANYTFAPVNLKFTNLQANLPGQNFVATQILVIKYSISGKVTRDGVHGTSGVLVTFGTFTATTGLKGTYTINKIPAGTRGRIVPSLAGYGFTPGYITVGGLSANLVNENFTSMVVYTVSGKVTETGTGLPFGGVTVTLGSFSAVTSSTTGAYTIRNVPAGTSGALTPTLTGETFTPPTITITSLAASLHGQNFVAAP
jgi:chitinase